MANKLKRAVEETEQPKAKKATIPKSKQSTLTFKTVKPKRNETVKPSTNQSIKEETVKPSTKRRVREDIPSEAETESIDPPKKKRARRGLTQSIDAADAPKQTALELQRCRLLQAVEHMFVSHLTQISNATDATSDQHEQSQFFLSIVKCKDFSSVRQQCADRFGESKIERIETQLACCEPVMELSDCNACSAVSPFATCCNKCFSSDVQLKSRTIDWRLVRLNQAKLVQAAAKKLEKAKSKGQVDSADEDAEISSSPESSPEPSPSPESSPSLKAMRITSFASEPMSESELYQLRIECVLRSLDWSGRFAKRAKITNIDAHGGDMAFLYRFVIDMSEDNIKEAATKTVQTMIDKWEKSDLSIIDSHAEAEQVLEFTEALHAKIGMQLIKGGDAHSRDLTRQRQHLSKAVSHHSISDLCRFNASLCGKLPRTQSGYCTTCGQFQRVGLTECPLDDTELIHPKDLEAVSKNQTIKASINCSIRTDELNLFSLSDQNEFHSTKQSLRKPDNLKIIHERCANRICVPYFLVLVVRVSCVVRSVS